MQNGRVRKKYIGADSYSGQSRIYGKGVQAASLRNIIKTAGVTTGAFYGYYGRKEELFAALVVLS